MIDVIVNIANSYDGETGDGIAGSPYSWPQYADAFADVDEDTVIGTFFGKRELTEWVTLNSGIAHSHLRIIYALNPGTEGHPLFYGDGGLVLANIYGGGYYGTLEISDIVFDIPNTSGGFAFSFANASLYNCYFDCCLGCSSQVFTLYGCFVRGKYQYLAGYGSSSAAIESCYFAKTEYLELGNSSRTIHNCIFENAFADGIIGYTALPLSTYSTTNCRAGFTPTIPLPAGNLLSNTDNKILFAYNLFGLLPETNFSVILSWLYYNWGLYKSAPRKTVGLFYFTTTAPRNVLPAIDHAAEVDSLLVQQFRRIDAAPVQEQE